MSSLLIAVTVTPAPSTTAAVFSGAKPAFFTTVTSGREGRMGYIVREAKTSI